MHITMTNTPGRCQTGTLPTTVTLAQIVAVLGPANVRDDPWKVTHSWGFAIDGEACGIWDFKGHRWSTYGPVEKLLPLLGVDN